MKLVTKLPEMFGGVPFPKCFGSSKEAFRIPEIKSPATK